ncbi:unnamed protein product, partial [Mesorhabditis belari]|uniref:Uncharacterized protein n=1 Tax=Mesorhabditis belari TaxID=2138241 RepID=A0AAF3FH14_9BILA
MAPIEKEEEIHAIVDDLSVRLGQLGDGWLTASEKAPKYFEFTPIELYAFTERLKLAEPTISETNTSADLSNTVDFLSRVKNLKIRGSRGYVRSSNIVCNSLSLSLHHCKNLLSLWVADFDVSRIEGISHLRKSLRRLVIHYSMSRIRDFFVKEELSVADFEDSWESLEEADFSFNHLEEIDDSIRSLKALVRLNVSQNRLTSIGSTLQHLPRLSYLDLSKNNIASVSGWSQLLGQISVLKIANNSIKSLEGIAKLYSLEVLDASDNQLDTIESVIFIGNLPCLEVLNLKGNKVRKVVEYRTRILEAFEERAGLVTLDGQPGDAHEKDTIAVRLALKKAKEEKEMVDRERKEKIERSVRYISNCEGSDTSPYGSFRNNL